MYNLEELTLTEVRKNIEESEDSYSDLKWRCIYVALGGRDKKYLLKKDIAVLSVIAFEFGKRLQVIEDCDTCDNIDKLKNWAIHFESEWNEVIGIAVKNISSKDMNFEFKKYYTSQDDKGIWSIKSGSDYRFENKQMLYANGLAYGRKPISYSFLTSFGSTLDFVLSDVAGLQHIIQICRGIVSLGLQSKNSSGFETRLQELERMYS